MPGIIVIGAAWGDEGKGKVIDALSLRADYVVRFQGGANAGHTLHIKGKKHVLHLIPSGIFHSHAVCIMAAGMAIDMSALVEEIKKVQNLGLLKNPSKLLISDMALVLLPFHKTLDQLREKSFKHLNHKEQKDSSIGTTGRGIGPAYEDRASRTGLLFKDLFLPKKKLEQKLFLALREKNCLIKHCYKNKPFRVADIMQMIMPLRAELKKHRVANSSFTIHQALKKKKKLLFEGAQGTLLDLWHGTYPYVTSSSTLAGSAMASCGVGPFAIQKVVGVAKSYMTRVGLGPFPTECNTKMSATLRKLGVEWGATTGRKRRCGWLDLVALKYAVYLNGMTDIALMKLDVLSSLDVIPVCVSYRLRGKVIEHFPAVIEDLALCRPVYKNFPGWKKDISQIKKVADLPKKAYNYVDFIQKKLNIPICMISVGSGREDTLWQAPLFE